MGLGNMNLYKECGQEFATLYDGNPMPRLGLGTWKAPAEKTKAAVKTAVKAGYRMIDCANDYDNEHVIGEALQELFKEGVVKREELFIQAKLWNSNHRPEHVKPDILKTLEDLQLDYLTPSSSTGPRLSRAQARSVRSAPMAASRLTTARTRCS